MLNNPVLLGILQILSVLVKDYIKTSIVRHCLLITIKSECFFLTHVKVMYLCPANQY